MRILIVGTSATGEYFGGRMLQAGLDVTFLARASAAAQLQASGLMIHSCRGDAMLKPRVISWLAPRTSYGAIFLCCRAHDLENAMHAMSPAVGKHTMIVPTLDGLHHLQLLDERFGAQHVLGGLCSIAVRRSCNGSVNHLGSGHLLRFGERDGTLSPRVATLETCLQYVNLDVKASHNILPSMWEKWALLAGLAGMSCLMRAELTTTLKAPGGHDLYLQMLDECSHIAAANGFPLRPKVLADVRSFLDAPSGLFKSSMLRDIEQGEPTDADPIIGDLLARAEATNVAAPLLRIAYCHLKAYQLRMQSPILQATYNKRRPAATSRRARVRASDAVDPGKEGLAPRDNAPHDGTIPGFGCRSDRG